MNLSISLESFQYLVKHVSEYIRVYEGSIKCDENDTTADDIQTRIENIEKEVSNLGKAASVEDAKAKVHEHIIHRTFLGWSLSHMDSPDISVIISDEDAKMLLGLMDSENIKDQTQEID